MTTRSLPVDRKSTLYCPQCWYHGTPDETLATRRVDDGVAIVCPRCETTLTVRPAETDLLSASREAAFAWQDLAVQFSTAWTKTAAACCGVAGLVAGPR